MKSGTGMRRAFCVATVLFSLIATRAALAVPSFARQTGMACEACHTVFPELTHFGRVFKANGYILNNLTQVRGVTTKKQETLALTETPPFSIMFMVSYTHLNGTLPDLSSVGSKTQNGTVGFPQQLSIFYGGEIAPHFGGLIQATYSNVSGSIGIDNTDLRFADMRILPDNRSLIYGLSLNNNPTVQDIWNSTPAFGFPFASSNAVISPLAHTEIDGTLAQSIAGISAYVFWNESLYAEVGGYRSAKQGVTNSLTGAAGPLDGTTSNVIEGVSPYWRVAYEYQRGRSSFEIGAYGADFELLPGGTPAAPSPLTGPHNRFNDVAEDFQYQFMGEDHLFSLTGTHIHEKMTLNASYPAAAANPSNTLTTTRVWATYYYRRWIGGTVQYFSTTGSTDNLLYPPTTPGQPGVITSANGSPDTNGWIAEVNYLPWLNTKISAQYTAYNKFNGASTSYDGLGRNASANNTWYLLLWFAF